MLLLYMHKFIGMIVLTLTLLSSVMDLHDLAKIPTLIEHFNEHRSKSLGFSFLDFLSLHYGSEANHHDKEEHSKHTGLPFKSSDCTFTHTMIMVTHVHDGQASQLVSVIRYTNSYQSAFSAEFSQSIWQPPKFI